MSSAERLVIRAKLNDQKRTYRDIAIDPGTNLYGIAEYVIGAFDFDFDHCFGFFGSPDIYGKGKDTAHYELFYDIGEEVDANTQSVQNTPASELFSTKKDKWWMLFDYGDEWIFELECMAVDGPPVKSGEVTKVAGAAPSQYGY